MSRLAKNRSVSRAEFVKVAGEIFHGTVDFCTKLSARYQRLLAADTIHLAREVRIYCIKAQETYPGDEVKRQLRERYLLQAQAAWDALVAHTAYYAKHNDHGRVQRLYGYYKQQERSAKV